MTVISTISGFIVCTLVYSCGPLHSVYVFYTELPEKENRCVKSGFLQTADMLDSYRSLKSFL